MIAKRYSMVGGVRKPSGLTKDGLMSDGWRVLDRLLELGLVEVRNVAWHGPTYFINEAGRKALQESVDGP